MTRYIAFSSSTRTLTTTTSSLKSSQAELQRTRTALQSLRATHQAELKKVEKEKDRLLEKVAKLSEHQYVTRVAGIRYANENAVSQYGASSLGPGASSTTPAGQVLGGTGDFLEVTLEESLRHRQELADENRALKALLLRVANDIQLVDFQARAAAADLLVVKKDVGKQLDVEEVLPALPQLDQALLTSRPFVIARTFDIGGLIPSVTTWPDNRLDSHFVLAFISPRFSSNFSRPRGTYRTR